MLYEVITLQLPDDVLPRGKFDFFCFQIELADDQLFYAFGIERQGNFIDGINIVITSYSIHYTKLYEDDQNTCQKQERTDQREE